MHPPDRPIRQRSGADLAAAGCAALFVGILAVSAYWDPNIRVLHLFESIPYLAAGALCLRQSKFGYALGVASGAFWLWTAGFLTTFIRNGFERVVILARTGSVDRVDVLIAVPAAIGTAGLVACSIAGYARLRDKSWRDVGPAALAIIAVPVFSLVIIRAFAPQYLAMFRGMLN